MFYGVEPLHRDYGRSLESAGIQYSVIAKRPGFDLRSIFALAREIRRIEPELVVMHGGGTAWHWPLLWLLGVRAKLVLVEHGQTGGWTHTRHAIGILSARALIAISEPLAALLRKKFGILVRRKPLRAIPNGVDADFFCPSEKPRSDDRILCVATLSPIKDQATLIQACSVLSRHRRVKLLLAGDGVTRAKLREMARECAVEDQTTFLGNVSRSRLLSLYQEAAVFVLSTKSEGISFALLEAMACACPIVASDVPGVTEVLSGTGAGLLVPPGDAQAMADAIEHLLDHPELGATMGDAARQCAIRKYSAKQMAAQYSEILNSLSPARCLK
jgi:glycosyltransferase involved in cell wall biosynthesis